MRGAEHFDHLLHLIDLEQRAAVLRVAEAQRDKTNAELVREGFMLDDVEAEDEAWGLGGRLLVTFKRATKERVPPTFDPGSLAVVALRRDDGETVKAVVARRAGPTVTLAFDLPPPPFVTAGRVLITLGADTTTFDRARNTLRRVKGWDKGAVRRRRDVLLGAEPPRTGPDKPIASPLNPEQTRAVQQSLAAQDFFLVHGPPGTGKTTVLVDIAERLVKNGRRILATAASNAAVDHLLELCVEKGLRCVRIGHPARVAERLLEHTLDEMVEAHPSYVIARELMDEAFELRGYARRQRTQGRSRERFQNARQAQFEARRLLDEARQHERVAVRSVLERTDVVCCTCAGLERRELQDELFDVALLDEATQAIEPVALAPFLRAETVILAGDPQQLPPTVLSQEAAQKGLSTSLFERLLAEHGDGVRLMLREQHRMCIELMRFPSSEMYGGELRAHPSVEGRRLRDLDPSLDVPPLLFVDTAGRGFDEERPEGQTSYENPGEASLVIAQALALVSQGLSPKQLAIITPYRAQATRLGERARILAELDGIEIDTVDAFQGREKDAVLISLVRANAEASLGFLSDLRRMNVAITRAKRHLFLVGDSGTFGAHPFYQRLLEEAQAQGGYVSVWEWPAAQEL